MSDDVTPIEAADAFDGEERGRASERWLQRLAEFTTMIRSVARQRGLDPSAVEEIVQDVRVRVWKARGQGEEKVEITSSYLYQTAMSATLDHIRRERRQRTTGIQEADGLASGSRSGPAEEAEGSELESRVVRAVADLPEHEQAAVRMHLLGYKRSDIVEVLGWTDGRARNVLHRGLTKVRTMLVSWGYGPGEVA